MSDAKFQELVYQMIRDARAMSIATLWETMAYLDQVIIRDHYETGRTSELAYAAIKAYGDELQTRIYGVRPN